MNGQSNFSLKVTSGPDVGKTFELQVDRSFKFGRHESNDFILSSDTGISRQHFEISSLDGRFSIQDLNSRNGTYLNRRAILTSELAAGDEIRAGNTILKVMSPEPLVADRPVTNDALVQSGADLKAKVEFRYRESDTTVNHLSIRLSRLERPQLFHKEFACSYLDMPGRVVLLNVEPIDRAILKTETEPLRNHAKLIFPESMQTMGCLLENYFGQDVMIMMNYSCRRTRLISLINDHFAKFTSPSTLIREIKSLPAEVAAGLMNGIDLAICESEKGDYAEVIHSPNHRSWLSQIPG